MDTLVASIPLASTLRSIITVAWTANTLITMSTAVVTKTSITPKSTLTCTSVRQTAKGQHRQKDRVDHQLVLRHPKVIHSTSIKVPEATANTEVTTLTARAKVTLTQL